MNITTTIYQAAALSCGVLFAASVQASPTATAVGEATLVIGQANVIAASGQTAAIERGTVIRVGDTVQTHIGGHVHLRFVDGGRVSVRPSSRLQIENYAHSSQQPQLNAIKFKLDEGVVRSITGAWGESARDRFRLNTPLAAIGVKGTDFIVSATDAATAATVFTGAITLAPLQGSCIDSLGPCLSGGEKLLSDEMRGQMVELARLQSTPRLVPAVDLMVASLPQAPAIAAVAQSKPPAADNTVLVTAIDKPLLGEARAAGIVNAHVVNALGPDIEKPSTLSWVRYPWARPLTDDNFSQPFEIAMLQGHERLGGNGAYALLRQTVDGLPVAFAPDSGTAQFQLTAAGAHVVRDAGNRFEPVQLGAATLKVDFNRATFDTRLQASGPQLGTQAVFAAGTITPGGTMQVNSGNSNLQGGFSANGREAGYAFQTGVPNGVLQGVTLWGR